MNTNELKAQMARHGHTNHDLASIIGTSDATCSLKVNGKSDFSQTQIAAIKREYCLTDEEVNAIFFAEEVS